MVVLRHRLYVGESPEIDGGDIKKDGGAIHVGEKTLHSIVTIS